MFRVHEKKPLGFSLVEAMLAMGLVFTILGLISTLMREYSSVARHSDARDNTFDGVQYALAEMSHELGSAVQVTAEGSSLGFYRLDPSIVRFPLTNQGTPVTDFDWLPRDPQQLMLVQYQREPSVGSLVRKTTGPSGNTRQTMVEKISGINVEKVKSSPDLYLIALSFQEDKRLRSYSTQARLWVAQ